MDDLQAKMLRAVRRALYDWGLRERGHDDVNTAKRLAAEEKLTAALAEYSEHFIEVDPAARPGEEHVAM